MGWYKPCEILNERGTRSSITRGLSSTTSPSQRNSSDGHKQRQKQNVFTVRLHGQHDNGGADLFLQELIPKEHWEIPSWIDNEIFEESAKILKENDIQYGSMKSYHQMCRWNSGLFYKHPALANTQYYWRVEPKVHFFCDVDYDVFRFMHDHNKTYGFTINLYDAPKSIPTLWPETTKFIAQHPEYLHDNNAMMWLTDSARRPEHNMKANGYSTCHFWSNFEIADMAFWRSQAYEDYFNHLDRAGGFFYERWGDAPVHSIALGLFEDSSKVHW
jgi:mannosyltransferase